MSNQAKPTTIPFGYMILKEKGNSRKCEAGVSPIPDHEIYVSVRDVALVRPGYCYGGKPHPLRPNLEGTVVLLRNGREIECVDSVETVLEAIEANQARS